MSLHASPLPFTYAITLAESAIILQKLLRYYARQERAVTPRRRAHGTATDVGISATYVSRDIRIPTEYRYAQESQVMRESYRHAMRHTRIHLR